MYQSSRVHRRLCRKVKHKSHYSDVDYDIQFITPVKKEVQLTVLATEASQRPERPSTPESPPSALSVLPTLVKLLAIRTTANSLSVKQDQCRKTLIYIKLAVIY